MSSNEKKEEILMEIIEINDEIQQAATNFGNLTNQVDQKEEEIKVQKNKLEILMKKFIYSHQKNNKEDAEIWKTKLKELRSLFKKT